MAEPTFPIQSMTAKQMRLVFDVLKSHANSLRQQALQANQKGNRDEGLRLNARAAEINTLMLRFQI